MTTWHPSRLSPQPKQTRESVPRSRLSTAPAAASGPVYTRSRGCGKDGPTQTQTRRRWPRLVLPLPPLRRDMPQTPRGSCVATGSRGGHSVHAPVRFVLRGVSPARCPRCCFSLFFLFFLLSFLFFFCSHQSLEPFRGERGTRCSSRGPVAVRPGNTRLLHFPGPAIY